MPQLILSVEQSPGEQCQPVRLGSQGGSIGRSPDNDLVLPDTQRQVSRVHIHMLFRRDGPRAVCVGTNAFLHNGVPIEQGEECSLLDSDKIALGGYLLRVRVDSAS